VPVASHVHVGCATFALVPSLGRVTLNICVVRTAIASSPPSPLERAACPRNARVQTYRFSLFSLQWSVRAFDVLARLLLAPQGVRVLHLPRSVISASRPHREACW